MTRPRSSSREARTAAQGPGRIRAAVNLAVLGLIAGAFTAGAYALYMGLPADFELSTKNVADLVKSLGLWGHVALVGLMVVHSFVPFPAELVAFAAGMCYGPVWGTVLTWTGAMLGASLSFALVRALGRPFVEATLPLHQQRRLDEFTREHGASTLLLVRLIPVIAFNLINYAAGLTRVSWPTFLWTTGLGIAPLTLLMVIFGARMHELVWTDWLVFALAAGALWTAAVWAKNALGASRRRNK